jgi:uncharacterized Tic20 family protein
MNRWLHLVAPSCEAKWSARPEGTNHTPEQNKVTDANARILNFDLSATLSSISSILFLVIFLGPTYNQLQAVISEILVFAGYIVNDNSAFK